jgi:hypothetical protein
VFHNQQSLGALLGIMGNADIVDKVRTGVIGQYSIPANRRDELESRVSHKTISSTASYQVEASREEASNAQKTVMDSLTPAIGKAAEAFGDLASKYPLLTGVTTLATTALAALAGAAGLATVGLGGKLPGGGAIERYTGTVVGSPAGKTVLRGAKVGGIAGLSALAGDYALEKGFGADSAISRYGSSALNGAAVGATLGSVVPLVGTGVGALAGGALGAAIQGLIDLQRSLRPAEQKPLDVSAKLQVGLAPGLVLQSQSMDASGGKVYLNTGNMNTGAPG